MKLVKFLSNNIGGAQELRPTFRPFGDLFQGISSGVNGGISNILGYLQNDDNTEEAWNMAKFQTGASMLENQYARQWQSQMYDRQRDDWFKQQSYMYDLWKKQTDYENAYNSPSNQVSRLLAAGINPASMFGQVGNAGNSSSNPMPTSPNPSVPGASSGSLGIGTPNFMASSMNPAAIFSAVASGAKAIAEMRKTGAETDFLEKSMSDLLRKYKSDADMAETMSAIQEINLQVSQSTRDVKVQKEFSELFQSIAQHRKLLLEGDESASRALKIDAERLKTMAEKHGIDIKNSKLPAMLDADVSETKARAAEHRESASKMAAETKTENQSREFKIRELKAAALIAEIQQDIDQKTKFEKIQSLKSQLTKDMWKSEADAVEFQRKLAYLEDVMKLRDSAGNASRLTDDLIMYITNHIGVSLGGLLSR